MKGDLLSSSAGGKRLGELECGCVISPVVSVDPPRADIRWCLTHGHARKLRQAMNLIAGYTIGAQARIRSGGYSPSRAIDHLLQIQKWAVAALPDRDTAAYVQRAGPGKEAK